MSTVKPLRMVLALDEAQRPAFVDRVFRAYWSEDRDISDGAVLEELANDVGLDGAALVAKASDETLKRALREATDEAARRGVFGAPSFFVGDLLFWGQDRLEMVEKALRGWRPPGE
jgi:2-hydroxychromene-2-carboxylate isomerase